MELATSSQDHLYFPGTLTKSADSMGWTVKQKPIEWEISDNWNKLKPEKNPVNWFLIIPDTWSIVKLGGSSTYRDCKHAALKINDSNLFGKNKHKAYDFPQTASVRVPVNIQRADSCGLNQSW